jgi:hypothetical protein
MTVTKYSELCQRKPQMLYESQTLATFHPLPILTNQIRKKSVLTLFSISYPMFKP